jgi:hypothetical protein
MHIPGNAARLKFAVLWLVLASVAASVCSLQWSAAHLAGESLPVGVDSFYHARRILDTAQDPAAFYQFDAKIHVPEGSLLSWPWGYDYAMGWLTRLAMKTGITSDPMAFLIWVPVAAVFLSVRLMMLIARRLQLSTWSTVLAALCVALSPLTQLLHGIGTLDHHFAEYIVVLAALAAGLRWLSRPDDTRAAVALGLVLGLAPAVHNGMFVLQLPLLLTLFTFWLQNIRLPRRTAIHVAITLIVATVAILIPSLPFRHGHFEFYTLSWFHLYVGAGTAVAVLLLHFLPRTRTGVAVLVLTALVLLLPLVRQTLIAQAFLAGTIKRLDAIGEMQSIRNMTAVPGGLWKVSLLYSLSVWLLPFSAAYCLFRAWAERSSARLFFWIFSICGLAMLVTQFRLHYFGSFALFLPGLIAVERAVAGRPQHRKRIMLGVSLALVLMYAPPLRYQLAVPYAPAGDPTFPSLRYVLATLQRACAEEPGVVLADNDAGHYIRYYTQCSVIANNFLLTRQHEEKIAEIDRLTALPAAELPGAAPYVRYVLVRPVSIKRLAPDQVRYMSFSPDSGRQIEDLLLKTLASVPPAYELLIQANIRPKADEEAIPYIRLYKIRADSAGGAPPSAAASRNDAAH